MESTPHLELYGTRTFVLRPSTIALNGKSDARDWAAIDTLSHGINRTDVDCSEILCFEILSKVVYAERAHPVEMISKVSLGGLLDLFLTVDEFDARYDFGEQFRTVEPAPVFLGFQAQFKDHGQCRDS